MQTPAMVSGCVNGTKGGCSSLHGEQRHMCKSNVITHSACNKHCNKGSTQQRLMVTNTTPQETEYSRLRGVDLDETDVGVAAVLMVGQHCHLHQERADRPE